MSELQIYNCEQNSEEWLRVRAGIPTASQFHTVLAQGRSGGESKTRRTYMLKLIGERLTGQPADSFTNHHTERGHEMEPEARDLYAMVAGVDPVRVGFIRRGDSGASPDSLIGNDGLLEIKTKLAHLQLDLLLGKDELPSEHKPQCQGQLWIAQREWVDFVSYWPGLPLFRKRVFRDEPYIAKLKVEVDAFNAEMQELIERLNKKRNAA